MDNFNGFQQVYQQTPTTSYQNYYQPQTPVYQPRWQQTYTAVPTVPQNITTPQYQSQNIQQNSNIFWVQGESGAKSYSNLMPGIPIALWDSEEQVIYIKTIDQNGKPSMTIIDYTERGSDDKQDVKRDDKKDNVGVEYITREQFNNLNENVATKEQLGVLNEQFSSINNKLKELSNFATVDQIKSFGERLDDLDNQINDIEDRIMSFGKPQNNSNSSSRRGNK